MKFDISHWNDAYLTWNTTEWDILKRLIVYRKTIVHDLEVTSAHGSSVWQEATSFMQGTLISEIPLWLEGSSSQEICKHHSTNQKVAFADKRAKSQHRLSEYLEQILNCILLTFVLMWPEFLAGAT